MKLLSTTLTLSMVLAASTAFADEPIKLKLKVEPVTNQAELHQLMRQNTVRVALQRYRLWQQAAASEQARAQDQDGEELQSRDQVGERSADKLEGREADEGNKTATRKRSRVKHRTADRRADQSPGVAKEQASKADSKPAQDGTADGEPAQDGTATRKRERKQSGAATAENTARQSSASQQREELRNILRQQRLGGENLDGKLHERTRSEERTQRRNQDRREGKQQQRKGQSGNSSRGGGR